MIKQCDKSTTRKPSINVLPESTRCYAQRKTISILAGERNPPAFKPGSTPHMQYGNEMINANVPWNEVISDLCSHGLSMVEIATRLDVDFSVIQAVAAKNYSRLNFKAGARLLTMHAQQTAKIV